MNCQYCPNQLTYPLEQREKLCSTHLYLDGGFADKMMITNKGHIIPKPECLPLASYLPSMVWRFSLMIGTGIIGTVVTKFIG